MINIAFARNMKNLQRVIEFLSANLDNDANSEPLRIAIGEFRQWVKMLLDYEDKITEEPKESMETIRNNIYNKAIQALMNTGIPLKWVNKFKRELKKYRWSEYGT